MLSNLLCELGGIDFLSVTKEVPCESYAFSQQLVPGVRDFAEVQHFRSVAPLDRRPRRVPLPVDEVTGSLGLLRAVPTRR